MIWCPRFLTCFPIITMTIKPCNSQYNSIPYPFRNNTDVFMFPLNLQYAPRGLHQAHISKH